MTDMLLELSRNPRARKLVAALKLPLPLPQDLRRAVGAWEERPLEGEHVVVGGSGGGAVAEALATTICRAGGNPMLIGGAALLESFKKPGETFARPARQINAEQIASRPGIHALLFDACAIAEPARLRAMFDFFQPLVTKIKPCGRVLLFGRAPDTLESPAAAAAQAALEGFVRSLAKELGKRGSTALLVQVDAGAESRLEGVVRFLLSARSAFVTGQRLRVTTKLASKGEPAFTRTLGGKVAMVTGAARGIGAATAVLLANEGAHVVCLDRPEDSEALGEVARKVRGSMFGVDVTDADAPRRISEHLRQQHGGVDVVVHNAGITRDKTLARMKPEAWDQVLDVNLSSVLRMTDALLQGVLRDGGRIVCLSSMAGIAGNLGQTNYTASKAGIIGYVGSLAPQLASRGIGVNAVAPGFIETRMTAAIPIAIREVGRRLSSLSQGGLPQDVGEVVTFFSTSASDGLTGSVLRVCGGSFLGA